MCVPGLYGTLCTVDTVLNSTRDLCQTDSALEQ